MKTPTALLLWTALGLVHAQDEAVEESWTIGGKSYFETGTDFDLQEPTFENWTDTRLEKGNISIEAGFKAAQPARSYAKDTSGTGLHTGSLTWTSGDETMRVGHFYHQLGNGIVLRSYRDNVVRWDNNLLGFLWKHQGEKWTASLLSAEARDLEGARHAPLHGGGIEYQPWSGLGVGVNGILTRDLGAKTQNWGSGTLKWTHYADNWGLGARAEAARRSSDQQAKAHFVAADVRIGPWTLVGEFKDYAGFDLNNGAPLNNAPLVAKEHTFSLMARKQLQITANDVTGWTMESSWRLPGEKWEQNVRVTATGANAHAGDELYREAYGQYELIRDALGLTLGGGIQDDVEEKRQNGVCSGQIPWTDKYLVKFQFEHQWAQNRLSQASHYAQIYRATWSVNGKWSLGIVGEQLVEASQGQIHQAWWPGVQVDLHLTGSASMSLFGGLRRAGKDCSGGVCVAKPEFTGIEAVGNLSF